MKDKFSYTDFISYFIPGVMLLGALGLALRSLGGMFMVMLSNPFTESIFFLAFAFAAGHFVQARAIVTVAKSIRKSRGAEALLSEIYLIRDETFKNSVRFFTQSDKEKYTQIATKLLGYSESDLEPLASDSKEARQLSHSIFRKALSYAHNKKVGERAAMFSTHYKFFLGLALSSFYACVILVANVIVLLVLMYFDVYSWAEKSMYIIGCLLFAIPLFFAFFEFKKSAKNREELHVQEVFNSVYVLMNSGDKKD